MEKFYSYGASYVINPMIPGEVDLKLTPAVVTS